MQTIIGFFGFTTLTDTIWNIAAYLAFVGIVIGVFSERYRNPLFLFGTEILILYAGIFLRNPLFAALQTLFIFSTILQCAKTPKRLTIITVIILTVLAYFYLAYGGAITDVWSLIGSFGLLGMVFGLIILPKRFGFLTMAAGGALLIVYGFTARAWMFFLLNIFFTLANIYKWRKKVIKLLV